MTSQANPSSAWDRRRERISRHIELVAMELCLERGIDALTVEEIASAAGISRRTFYRYFDTVDDILCASPKRSLERIRQSVRERPASESIREAFVNGSYSRAPSEEESRLQTLGARIAEAQPAAWWRAMGRIQPSAQDIYAELATERLQASGKDPALAPLITAVLVAVVNHVAMASYVDGQFRPSPESLDRALAQVADLLNHR